MSLPKTIREALELLALDPNPVVSVEVNLGEYEVKPTTIRSAYYRSVKKVKEDRSINTDLMSFFPTFDVVNMISIRKETSSGIKVKMTYPAELSEVPHEAQPN